MNFRGYCKLFFIVKEVNNLDIDLGVTLKYFHNDRLDNFLEEGIDPTTILMVGCF